VARYLFFSHDGYGLGHVRRNTVIAQALRRAEPGATIRLVTGVPSRPRWLQRWGAAVIRVPPLIKDDRGRYRGTDATFGEAVARRAQVFGETVERFRPHVVVVDRHPLGTAGELQEGIELALRRGARLVLGLRDVLDDPSVIRRELQGEDWAAMPELFSKVLVYGAPGFCDHREEYGLPALPDYCGWVVEPPLPSARQPRLLAVAAGGGGDGEAVFRLATQALGRRPRWRAELAAGPFADLRLVRSAAGPLNGRVTVHPGVSDCRELFARASSVVQMAGYNSTFEALAAGHRSALVPRLAPRREQAIRARRLAERGLADVVEPDADPTEVVRLIGPGRDVSGTAVARAGLDLRGADRAAGWLRRMAEEAAAA